MEKKTSEKTGIADVRKSMKVVEKYLKNGGKEYDACREFVKVIGNGAAFVNNFKEFNYIDETIYNAKERGWLPVMVNNNRVVEYIKISSIDSYSRYSRNGISYHNIRCGGKEYEIPSKRQDGKVLYGVLDIARKASYDWCTDEAYKDGYTTNSGDKNYKA